MKTSLSLAAVLVFLALPAMADNYRIEPQFTIPTFEVTHLGFTKQSGRFDKVAGRATFEVPARKGSVDLTIYTASIDMASQAWTAHMKSEGLFDVEKYPTMRFVSDRLIFSGDKVVAAEGRFTMLGVTKPLRITVDGFHCRTFAERRKTICGADVYATIKRSDFGLVKYIPEVSDTINIHVPVEAEKE